MNLLLYKLFGESRNAHQERQDLAHAISLMTELGEAKRRNAESEPDEDAKWSITFDQIKEYFQNMSESNSTLNCTNIPNVLFFVQDSH